MFTRTLSHSATLGFLLLLIAACSGNDNSSSTASLQPITISGVLRYEDWEYGITGYTGNVTWKNIRYAIVDLIDETGRIVNSTTSSASGEYSISGAGAGLYLRVLAQTHADAPMEITINNYLGNTYSATAVINSDSPNVSLNLDIRDSDTVSGAFNMLDTLTAAAQFTRTYSMVMLPPLEVYWQRGASLYGTYYCLDDMTPSLCPQGGGMYVSGGFGNISGDIDHYDDDVLWHEFSHYLEDTLNIDDSPGGPHQLTENTLDLRLAWSEGWGNYFSIAVKAWLSGSVPDLLSTEASTINTQYIDSVGNLSNSDVNISIDMDNPGLCGVEDCYIFSSNEVAVAKVLNRLRLMYGTQAVWDVYEGYLAGLTSGIVNLESFWDGFLSLTQPDSGQLSILEGIYAERQVYYREDGYESAGDNFPNPFRLINLCTQSQCSNEDHIFYQATLNDDIDVIAFNAQTNRTYIVETFDLKNGADTYLVLLTDTGDAALDGTGNPLENDDRNDDCGECINDSLSFSSQIQFVPQVAGTYFVKVVTSADAGDGSGRYGSYTLRVTETQN